MKARSLSFAGSLALAGMASVAVADVRLSSDQINAHVSGNTLKVITENLQEARGYFSPDGSLKGRDGDVDFVGKWNVTNDQLCMDVPQFGDEFCRSLFVRDNQILMFTETGSPSGRIEITKGNPDRY